MRSRHLLPVAILLVLSCTPVAQAQFYQQFNPYPPNIGAPISQRPALSPYLNLLRGGDPAANYYLGVLPEYNNRSFQQLVPRMIDATMRYQETLDDRLLMEVELKRLPPTGHAAGFMIYQGYYNVPGQRGFIPYNPYQQQNQQAMPAQSQPLPSGKR
jgi:hypothetical protein